MSRRCMVPLLAAVMVAMVACGDGATSPIAGPMVVMKVLGDSQTAVVGARVAVAPTVRVEGPDGQPIEGIAVEFVIGGGGGSASGPSARTDSRGVAAVGGWTLGKQAGANALVAKAAGVAPVTFVATAVVGPPATMRAENGVATGTVGEALGRAPTVWVGDAYDNPIEDVMVEFTVTSGGGSATGTTAITDFRGHASVGSWTLGTVAGPNTLTASATGLPPLAVTATGLAGPPARILKTAGDGQTGTVRNPVDTVPVVQVVDVYGNPIGDVGVIFAVASGGGSVAPPSRTTDASGIATAGMWVLGHTSGVNTLNVVVTNLPLVTFTALAVDRCDELVPHTIGTRVDGELTTNSCRLANDEYTDLYSMTTTDSVSSMRLSMSAGAAASRLRLLGPGRVSLASTPDFCGQEYDYCSGSSSLRVLLPPGEHVVGAGLFTYNYYDEVEGGVIGPYSMESVSVPEDVTGCEVVHAVRGVTTAQRIDPTDCVGTFRSTRHYFDRIFVWLKKGDTYTIDMSSDEVDPFLELVPDWGGDALALNDDFGGTSNAHITFTPPYSNVYVIYAGTQEGETTGRYTLTIR